MKKGIVMLLLLFGLNSRGLSAPSGNVAMMPPELQTPTEYDRPPVEEPPGEEAPVEPIASPGYCSNRGRPGTNESHLRFTPPFPDPSYSNPERLNLPNVPGNLYISVKAGQTYTFRFRFKSDIYKYAYGKSPEKVSGSRISGFEDKYPYYTNWVCNGATSGIQPAFSGVAVMLWVGDSGGTSLQGYEALNVTNNLPPFDSSASGVYGFRYTPNTSQVGKTMQVMVIAQTGVTADERDYLGLYESDQSVYKVFITVEPSYSTATFYTASVEGFHQAINIKSTFIVTPNDNYIDGLNRVEYRMNNGIVLGEDSAIGRPRSLFPRPGGGQEVAFDSEMSFDSTKFLDGTHQFYIKGYFSGSGRVVTSPMMSLKINNNPLPGPAPLMYGGYDTRRGRVFLRTTSIHTGLEMVLTEFYLEGGTMLGNGSPVPSSTGSPITFMDYAFFTTTIPSGTYRCYVRGYYRDGTMGISDWVTVVVP